MSEITWEYDDGGRAAAGFRGDTRDCVTRAIAIATGKPYREVYDLVNATGRTERPIYTGKRWKTSTARTGVGKQTTRDIMRRLGWKWTPTMGIGTGCTVHLRNDDLPPGRIVVSVTGHIAAVIDGVLRDTYDCSRDGTRCVYGYWSQS